MTSADFSINQKLQVAIIGAASKKGSEYFKALEKRDDIEIVVCLLNKTCPEYLKSFTAIFYDGDIDKLLREQNIQIAIVALPHHEHQDVTLKLLSAGVNVIKEKPLALCMEQVDALAKIIKERGLSPVFTTVQRSIDPSFLIAKEQLARIGAIKFFNYQYNFALPSMTTGWRADKEKSGGGVLMDMGYHIIDIIHLFFDKPNEVQSVFDFSYPEMEEQGLEDGAKITMGYETFQGEIILHRHAEAKKEEFVIEGEKGTITITPKGCTIIDENGQQDSPATLSREGLISKMFDYYFDPENRKNLENDFDRNVDNVRLIETIYQKEFSSYSSVS